MPELPEVEALAADLRERATGRVIERAGIAEISVLKTYDPPLTALGGRVIKETGRYGKFLDLVTEPAAPRAGRFPGVPLRRWCRSPGWCRSPVVPPAGSVPLRHRCT